MNSWLQGASKSKSGSETVEASIALYKRKNRSRSNSSRLSFERIDQ